MQKSKTHSKIHNLQEYKTKHLSPEGYICNAPFTSLYFKPDGLIKPCCAHKNEFAFGKYPQQSIKKILHSKTRKKLQKKVIKRDLSYGCDICHENIEIGNFSGTMAATYKRFSPASKWPKTLEFELSHFCNLDCIMCELHTSKHENHTIYSNPFLKEIKPLLAHAEATSFMGGEPFLIPIYKNIWDMIANYNPHCNVHIQSNGTIYNDYIQELLTQLKIHIGISIDAIDKKLYEKIRRGANFDKVMENIYRINKLTNKYGRSINFSVCPMQINLQEIPQLFELSNQLKGTIYFNTVLNPTYLSIRRMHSSKLYDAMKFIENQNYKNYNNPNYDYNSKMLQDLCTSIISVAERNKNAEKKYHSKDFDSLINYLEHNITDNLLVEETKEFLKKYASSIKVTPYLWDELINIPSKELTRILYQITHSSNLKGFYDFFELNKQEI